MITGNIRSQIDQIWNVFWSGFRHLAPAEMFPVVEQVFPFLHAGLVRQLGANDSTAL